MTTKAVVALPPSFVYGVIGRPPKSHGGQLWRQAAVRALVPHVPVRWYEFSVRMALRQMLRTSDRPAGLSSLIGRPDLDHSVSLAPYSPSCLQNPLAVRTRILQELSAGDIGTAARLIDQSDPKGLPAFRALLTGPHQILLHSPAFEACCALASTSYGAQALQILLVTMHNASPASNSDPGELKFSGQKEEKVPGWFLTWLVRNAADLSPHFYRVVPDAVTAGSPEMLELYETLCKDGTDPDLALSFARLHSQ